MDRLADVWDALVSALATSIEAVWHWLSMAPDFIAGDLPSWIAAGIAILALGGFLYQTEESSGDRDNSRRMDYGCFDA